jgi:acyl carrier protein
MSGDGLSANVAAWIVESGVDITLDAADYATPLADLGVDSLDFFGMLELLEAKTGITIPDDAAATLKSVDDLAAFIRERTQS